MMSLQRCKGALLNRAVSYSPERVDGVLRTEGICYTWAGGWIRSKPERFRLAWRVYISCQLAVRGPVSRAATRTGGVW